jgi:hypothetical protein
LAARDRLFSRVHILDFGDPDICGYRYNPLETHDRLESSELVGDVLRVTARVLQGDLNSQRRLQMLARASFSIVAEAGGTLLDAARLLNMEGDQLRASVEHIVTRAEASGRKVRLSFVREYLDLFYCDTAGRERRDLVQSTWNMLNTLGMSDDRFRDFVSSPVSNLPLSKIINEGGYLLVRIPDGLDLNTRLSLGTLLVNRVQTLCARRTEEQRKRPFLLLADEAYMLFDQAFCQAAATVRNYGLSIAAAHQSDAQWRGVDGNDKLLAEFTANMGTEVFFGLSEDDAVHHAYSVFAPRGLEVKVVEEDHSDTITRSSAKTKAEQISKIVSKALAVAEGQSVSIGNGISCNYSESNGVSLVKGKGFTIAKGRNWSTATSKGISIALMKSETDSESAGSGSVNSSAQTDSTSEADGHSSGFSTGEGQSMFLSWSDGKSQTFIPVDTGAGHFGSASQSGMGRGSNNTTNRGTSEASSHSRSSGTALTKAIAEVVNAARGRAVSKGTSKGTSIVHSKSKGESESEAHSVSEAIALVKSVCEGFAKSRTETVSETTSRTVTDSEANGESHSKSEQKGVSRGHTVSRRTVRHSLDEEARLRSYDLANLPKREAYVLFKDTGKVFHIRSHEVPKFTTTLGAIDFVDVVLERTRPPAVEAPKENVFESLDKSEMEAVLKLPKPEGF